MSPRWIVLREAAKLRWGGDLRRHYVLSGLAARSDALDVDGWSTAAIRTAIGGVRHWPWMTRPRIAAASMLGPDALDLIRGKAEALAVDFHDDPALQIATLGIEPDPDWHEKVQRRKRANLDAFRTLVVPSIELAQIAELPLDKVVVAGNGTDPRVITPEPFPTRPAIGFMSGAAAGRGIEALIAASRLVRAQIPSVHLMLWLAATGAASEAYLADLKHSTAADPWIEYASAPYAEMSPEMGKVTVQCVPNPRAAYWDAVAPIKLFDAMASGRPVVVTPRVVMRTEVERHEAGLVAAGDDPVDLAEPLTRILEDAALATRLGANARAAAETEYDWTTIAAGLASVLDDL